MLIFLVRSMFPKNFVPFFSKKNKYWSLFFFIKPRWVNCQYTSMKIWYFQVMNAIASSMQYDWPNYILASFNKERDEKEKNNSLVCRKTKRQATNLLHLQSVKTTGSHPMKIWYFQVMNAIASAMYHHDYNKVWVTF